MKNNSTPENTLAVVCLLFSASMWGLIWYPLRLLADEGMSGIWSSLVMYLAAAVLSMPYLFRHFYSFTHSRGLILALAIAAGLTNVAFVVALVEGEVMRVMLLFYLSPIWTVLLGRWWLKEHLSFKAVILFFCAMLGSLIMLWQPKMGFPWPQERADILALIAGLGFATNNVLARKLADLPLALKTGATWWGVVVISFITLYWQGFHIPDLTVKVWAYAWLLGWVGIVAMTFAVLYGVAKMPVYRSSIIMLFELIVAAIGAWLLTEEVMSLQEWTGGILILVAAYGVARITINNDTAS